MKRGICGLLCVVLVWGAAVGLAGCGARKAAFVPGVTGYVTPRYDQMPKYLEKNQSLAVALEGVIIGMAEDEYNNEYNFLFEDTEGNRWLYIPEVQSEEAVLAPYVNKRCYLYAHLYDIDDAGNVYLYCHEETDGIYDGLTRQLYPHETFRWEREMCYMGGAPLPTGIVTLWMHEDNLGRLLATAVISPDTADPRRDCALINTLVTLFEYGGIEIYEISLTGPEDEGEQASKETRLKISVKNGEHRGSELPREYQQLLQQTDGLALTAEYWDDCRQLLNGVIDCPGAQQALRDYTDAMRLAGAESQVSVPVYRDRCVSVDYRGVQQVGGQEAVVLAVENLTSDMLVFMSVDMSIDGVALYEFEGKDFIPAGTERLVYCTAEEPFPTETPRLLAGEMWVAEEDALGLLNKPYLVSYEWPVG